MEEPEPCDSCGGRGYFLREVTSTKLEYIGHDGTIKPCVETLPDEEKTALLEHLVDCDTALGECERCWRLYTCIGHEAYVTALTAGMEDL
jgi:hypothetical protein